MSGVKGRSGRRPNPPSLETGRRTMSHIEPYAWDAIKKAIHAGDPTTARWLIEMRHGKPKQGIDMDATLTQIPDSLAREAQQAIKEAERILNGTQRTGQDELPAPVHEEPAYGTEGSNTTE